MVFRPFLFFGIVLFRRFHWGITVRPFVQNDRSNSRRPVISVKLTEDLVRTAYTRIGDRRIVFVRFLCTEVLGLDEWVVYIMIMVDVHDHESCTSSCCSGHPATLARSQLVDVVESVGSLA